MKVPDTVYHGTCRAFVVYAQYNKGLFGPASGGLWFTPQLDNALEYAEQWTRPEAIESMQQFFLGDNQTTEGFRKFYYSSSTIVPVLRKILGADIRKKFQEPVVLGFGTADLGKFSRYEKVDGYDEFCIERPVDIHKAKEMPFTLQLSLF